MRLLHAGDFGDREGSAGSESRSHSRSNPRSDFRKPVPLHGLSADFRSGRSRGAQNSGAKEFGSVNGTARTRTVGEEGAWRMKKIRGRHPLALSKPTATSS